MRTTLARLIAILCLIAFVLACSDQPTSMVREGAPDARLRLDANGSFDAASQTFTVSRPADDDAVGVQPNQIGNGVTPSLPFDVPAITAAPFAFSHSFQVPLVGFGFGLATDGTQLYWYGPDAHFIHILDPNDGSLLGTLNVLANTRVGLALTFDGTNLFYTDDNFGALGTIYEMTTLGVPVNSFPTPGTKTITAMTFFDNKLYAIDHFPWQPTLYVLEPSTGNVINSFTVDVPGPAQSSLRSMARHGNKIVAYDNFGDLFMEIDPRNGKVTRTYNLPPSPLSPQFQAVTGMASDGTKLYVLEIDHSNRSYITAYVPRVPGDRR